MMHLSTEFTPLASFSGGLLIGLAVTLLWLGLGRVAGISGILGQLLQGPLQSGQDWRLSFVGGLLLGGLLLGGLPISNYQPLPAAPWWLLLLAGLLVGFGTRLGSGCTSGHGVCGISRGSPRSLLATLLFMLSAILTLKLLS